MPHPHPNHLYTVKKDGVFAGNFSWTEGPPPTYTLLDEHGEVVLTGPYEREPMFPVLFEEIGGTPCGDVVESPNPDGSSIACSAWPVHERRTLHH